MKPKKFLFFLTLALPIFLFSLEKKEPQCLRTSIIIPCHYSHFPLLEPLLEAYQQQSVLPDEIVISLSEAQLVSASLLARLEEKQRPFALKLLRHKQKYSPGRNRNEACSHSQGDLIICQDADDLPHSQRVEIIKYLFENYHLEHLLHQWQQDDIPFIPYSLDEAANSCCSFRIYEQITLPEVHNGSVSLLRSLFDKVHWQPLTGIHEDVLFNRSAYIFCKYRAVLPRSLLKYRWQLSTFDLDGKKTASRFDPGSTITPQDMLW